MGVGSKVHGGGGVEVREPWGGRFRGAGAQGEHRGEGAWGWGRPRDQRLWFLDLVEVQSCGNSTCVCVCVRVRVRVRVCGVCACVCAVCSVVISQTISWVSQVRLVTVAQISVFIE